MRVTPLISLSLVWVCESIEVEVSAKSGKSVPWSMPSLCARARLSKVDIKAIACTDCSSLFDQAVYVITSSKSEYKPRHEIVTEHLHKYGLSHRYVYKWGKVTKKDFRCFWQDRAGSKVKPRLENGGINAVEIMIAGKMLASMADMVKRSLSHSLIVEDDIQIMISPEEFQERITTVIHDDPNADFIFIGGCFNIHAKTSWEKIGKWLYRVPTMHPDASRCGHAYIMTQKGAKKYLEYGVPLLGPADWNFNLIHKNFPDVVIDFLEPPIICQGSSRGGANMADQLECGHDHVLV
jgi:hypothetical protein